MDVLNPNIETIEKVAKIVKDNELSEISVKYGDMELTVKGKKFIAAQAQAVPAAMPAMSGVQPAAAESNPAAPMSGKQVKAPIVGTFYSAPSPDSKPFVSVGQSVKKGDVIFIIESMKVMNEVQSEFDGVVKEICVQSGDPVEFDQTIMILE